MNKFLKLISRQWYLYLIAPIFSVFVINYTLDLVNKPRNEETITIFIASSESGSSSSLRETLTNNKPDYLREINIFTVQQDGNDFNRMFSIYGRDNSDIVILPKNKIDDAYVTSYYAPFSDEFMQEVLPNSKYYTSEETGKNYGIKLHSVGEENTLIKYKSETFDEDYYAFFMKNSKHIGELNNSSFTTAFSFIDIIKNN